MSRQSEAFNKDYFQALGSMRASVRMLSLAWAGLVCMEHRPDSCILFYQGAIHSRSLFACSFSLSVSPSIVHAGLSNHVIQQDIHL